MLTMACNITFRPPRNRISESLAEEYWAFGCLTPSHDDKWCWWYMTLFTRFQFLWLLISYWSSVFGLSFVSNIHRLGLQSRSYKAWKQNQNCGWYNITLHYWENAILIQLRIMEYTDIVHIEKVQCLHNWLFMSSLELLTVLWPHVVFKQWSGGPVYNV